MSSLLVGVRKDCGGDLTATEEVAYVTSPGLEPEGVPSNYSHSLYCQWTVANERAVNSTTVFRIEMLDVEQPAAPDGGCIFDSLDFIGDGTAAPGHDTRKSSGERNKTELVGRLHRKILRKSLREKKLTNEKKSFQLGKNPVKPPKTKLKPSQISFNKKIP